MAVRVSALERGYRELLELVDGQHSWSHRKRLHTVENNQAAARLASEALTAYRQARDSRANKIREWGGFVLGVAAVVFTIATNLH